jgi:hypothetical protein
VWAVVPPWGLVVLCEVVPVLPFGLFTLVLQAGQLGCWLVAVAMTAYFVRGRAAKVAVGMIPALVAVWFTNWSLLEPSSYLRLHRAQFEYIAAHPPPSAADLFDSGEDMLWWAHDLSITGKAVGTSAGSVYLEQNQSILGGSIGYVHSVSPAETFIVAGEAFGLGECLQLTDDWYWC